VTENPYTGPPSPEVDSAWHLLLGTGIIRVMQSDVHGSNATLIPLPNGGFAATLAMTHEMHCVRHLRRMLFIDYYYPNITNDDVQELTTHSDHCLGVLLQAVMCGADTTVSPLSWVDEVDHPIDPHLKRLDSCVDWELLNSGLQQQSVGPDEIAQVKKES